jgi:uncharacterized protein YfcZ (UPF0381/DUF406 family)
MAAKIDLTERITAASRLYATYEQIDKALDDLNVSVRKAVASNPAVTERNINKALDDVSCKYVIRYYAAGNPSATGAVIDTALDSEDHD